LPQAANKANASIATAGINSDRISKRTGTLLAPLNCQTWDINMIYSVEKIVRFFNMAL
jgi:hypothetical protein